MKEERFENPALVFGIAARISALAGGGRLGDGDTEAMALRHRINSASALVERFYRCRASPASPASPVSPSSHRSLWTAHVHSLPPFTILQLWLAPLVYLAPTIPGQDPKSGGPTAHGSEHVVDATALGLRDAMPGAPAPRASEKIFLPRPSSRSTVSAAYVNFVAKNNRPTSPPVPNPSLNIGLSHILPDPQLV